ncbi:heme receptor [Komagataeibacter xylinus]|uniref:TonB-dependent receptor n=2 Tax=Komagataeibacter swingsii TaxID=215220 RepID=A0A850P0S5_9PROT|nr:Outer membrane heme receptor [Komagataeibacter xylinus E25]NVN36743.1 TonB-dependent receptor [Komagataeibacter swingsii]RFP02125.1 heme receptor [Komagataeibacter xylinus]RFP07834.1 heme receptor [Komagataeibacter xylinus]
MTRSRFFCSLLVTTAFISAFSETGRAAPVSSGKTVHPTAKPVRTAAATPSAPPAPKVETLNAVGIRRRSHGTQISMGQQVLRTMVPGTNPLKALAQTPGVVFQSDDPQGVDTYSVNLYMHGFAQNEIGMTMDGIPLGEPVYRAYNGLNPVQAISSENVERLDVTQSAGAEGAASTNNLGGSINYVSSDPKDRMGGQAAQTFGSNKMYHTFFRFDSGALNKTGTKFYASYMRNETGKWKGGSDQFMQQVNAKIVQPIGQDSKITAFFDWDNLQQTNYQDYSPYWMQHNGTGLDNFIGTPNGYQNAYNYAVGHGLPSNVYDARDSSYYDSTSMSYDYFGGLTADLALTNHVRWKTTIYGHEELTRGTYTNPYGCGSNYYIADPTGTSADAAYCSNNRVGLNGNPMFEQTKRPTDHRYGILSSVTYNVAHHQITGGVWYENNKYVSDEYGYAVPFPKEGQMWDQYGNLPSGGRELWGQTYNTNTFTAFVADTYHPVHNLALHFGFKSMLNTTRVGEDANYEPFTGVSAITGGESLTTAEAFMPHISADWTFLHNHELFFDISKNAHAYSQSGYNLTASPMAVSQAAFNDAKSSLRPETAWTYAVGYRYHDRLVQGSIYAYRTNFSNRMQQIVTGGTVSSLLSEVRNVGGVTMNGVDAGVTLTPVRGLAITNSISYNHSTYDSDMTASGITYGTHGKQVVDYPRLMYKARAAYNWRNAEFYVDAQYMGQRSYSYTGDYQLPSYWLTNVGARYVLGEMGHYNKHLSFMHNVTFAFNIYNITDTKYASTVGQNGFLMSDPKGQNQSILLGAPRQFFGSVKADF